eukprot:1187230-Prorocentrum_minimum.AAC.4
MSRVVATLAGCGLYSLSPSAIGARYGYILSPLLRLVPDAGIFSLPFCDWCPLARPRRDGPAGGTLMLDGRLDVRELTMRASPPAASTSAAVSFAISSAPGKSLITTCGGQLCWSE